MPLFSLDRGVLCVPVGLALPALQEPVLEAMLLLVTYSIRNCIEAY